MIFWKTKTVVCLRFCDPRTFYQVMINPCTCVMSVFQTVNGSGSCFSVAWLFPIICGRNIRSYLYLLKLLSKRQHKQEHSSAHTPLGQAGYHVVQISGIFRTPFEFSKEVISRPDSVPFQISFALTRAKDHDAESYYERNCGSWMAHRWTIDDTVVSQLVRHGTL